MLRQLSEFFDLITGGDSFDAERSLASRLVGLLTFPFRFIFFFAGFLLTYWSASRPFPAFVRGLPAIAVGSGFLCSLILANLLLETRLVGNYQARYVQSLTVDDDAEMATNYAEKLIGLMPEESDHHYQLGIARYQNGDVDGAFDVMNYIANEMENSRAQVWLATTSLSDKSLDLSPEERDEIARQNYELAVQSLSPEEEPLEYTQAYAGLYRIYMRRNEPEVAIENLKNTLNAEIQFTSQLTAFPTLIKHYNDSGNIQAARNFLRQAIAKVRPWAEKYPDDIRIWSSMVFSCAMLDDFSQADALLKEGVRLARRPETRMQIYQLQSEVLIRQADRAKDISKEEQFKFQLNRLALAVTANPRSLAAYERLLDFVVSDNESPDHDLWLGKSVVASKTAAVSHIVLGLRALNSGRIAEGQMHWEIASKAEPKAEVIINFLIEYAYLKAKDRFENLNDIISVAIESFPRQPLFYVTRGRMYQKEEKFDRAIRDFEEAALKIPQTMQMQLRKDMVSVYNSLGNSTKAAESQQVVDELQQLLDAQQMARIEEQEQAQ